MQRQRGELGPIGEVIGGLGGLLALCCLPRTNPGNRTQYVRRNGPVTLVMNAGGIDYKLPYGNIPRLLLAYICTEAVRTQSRVLLLGDSVSEFMRKLDIYSSSGEKYTRLRNQMRRLFNDFDYSPSHSSSRSDYPCGKNQPEQEPQEKHDKTLYRCIDSPIPRLDADFCRSCDRHP